MAPSARGHPGPETIFPAFERARVHAVAGAADQAATWLEAAISQGYRQPAAGAPEADFDVFRDKLRLRQLLEALARARGPGSPR